MSSTVEDVVNQRERGLFGQLISSQAFWVTVALALICAVMAQVSEVFWTEDNFFNTTRNFAFIGIIALGMTAVVITGGIDLSVGSTMGMVGIVTGLVLNAGYPLWLGIAAGLATGVAIGAVNGFLIAYLKLSPFVVTLGMLSIGRSLALVVSDNRMIYEFGPDEDLFNEVGGGMIYGIANPVIVLVVLTVVFVVMLGYTAWGRWVYAIGGNEQAARLTGVPVNRIKMSVYILCGLMAAASAILLVGWQGAVTNALGQTYELRVIAASVIGGANLMGGAGGAYGAFIGAALIEVIRNSLWLGGVDPYWQGFFVGLFIILAVTLEKIRGRRTG